MNLLVLIIQQKYIFYFALKVRQSARFSALTKVIIIQI